MYPFVHWGFFNGIVDEQDISIKRQKEIYAITLQLPYVYARITLLSMA